MQLVAPQVLDCGRVRRAPEKPGKFAHDAQIGVLRLRRKLAHAHVVGHALAQWTGVCLWGGHDWAPAGERGGLPHSPTYGRARRTSHEPHTLAGAPYRASGFVLRPLPAIRPYAQPGHT